MRRAEPLTRGDVVGRYVVLSRVGTGGMGVVYAAFDPELDRKVALKLLHPPPGDDDGSSDEERARLLSEAQAMAKINHPNVVTVHDVGSHEGRVFVAMEFVRGSTLATWLKRDRSWREVLDAFVHAGRGLAAAHREGLVHRDFKPENVMVGDDGRVRVMDFGLARPTSQVETPQGDVAEGPPSPKVSGTPRYMAPEQWSGTATDARADQFSFCVALYEAFYGEPPFEGGDVAALVFNVTSGLVRRPPQGRVPRRVARVVAQGLAIDPQLRFATMDELLGALAPAASRRWGWALAVGAAAGIAAGVVIADRQDPRCSAGEDRLAQVWGQARRERARAAFVAAAAERTWSQVEAQLDGYVADWAAVHAATCEASAAPLRELCLERRLVELDARLTVFEEADAQIVGRALAITDAAEPIDACTDVERLRTSPPPPADPRTARAVAQQRAAVARANVLNEAAKYTAARELAQAAVEAATSLEYRPLLAEAHYELGWAAEAVGDKGAARTSFEEAVFVGRAALADDVARNAAIRLVTLVGVYEGKLDEGLAWARFAKSELARHAGWERSKSHAGLLRQIGIIYVEHHHYAEAQVQLERALSIVESLSGDRPNVQSASVLDALGIATREQGQLEDSRAYFERALELREALHSDDHPKLAQTLGNFSNLLDELDDDARAEQMQRRALAIRTDAFGPNHPEVARSLDSLAQLAAQRGDTAAARRQYERAIAIKEAALGAKHPSVAINVFNLGRLLQQQGDGPAAAAQYERALTIFTTAYGEEHPNVAAAREALTAVSGGTP